MNICNILFDIFGSTVPDILSFLCFIISYFGLICSRCVFYQTIYGISILYCLVYCVFRTLDLDSYFCAGTVKGDIVGGGVVRGAVWWKEGGGSERGGVVRGAG